MTAAKAKGVRCAIYTRVSTDAGLDQDFNSLDAQYDASQAYIRSQAHAGWTLVRHRYDDGGFSGGSTDRPALQQLLVDIKAHKIDVIVVYKVDRLTRSLADFAKLVELFDAHEVSFVSVTQQFNTTTSMGRLTLNVLLSFAQFEREVTSERIRDKIGASKRKGLWVGGVVPLGYHAKDRKITVVEPEAKVVRHIFRRYLELGSLNPLLADLRKDGITTKVRPLSTGRTIGGIPFTRGPLGYLLRNRFYIGEVAFKGEVFPGEQSAILERELFDAVQGRLERQRTNHTAARHASNSLLMGHIFDDRGRRMTPTYAVKNGVRYRYYISPNLSQGDESSIGKLMRIPAEEIETLIATAIRKHFETKTVERPNTDVADRMSSNKDLIAAHVARCDVGHGQLRITLSVSPGTRAGSKETSKARRRRNQTRAGASDDARPEVLSIAWTKTALKRRRQIFPPASSASRRDPRPVRSETRATLVAAIAKGRHWLDELVTGAVTNADQIAARERCSVRQVNMTLSLAFTAPALVSAAIEGRLPRGVGVANLRDAPLEWSRQFAMLGLASKM
jgi:DNA invertase Pin-like site-specific DNA recombinase